jgi:hypothetical protein
MLNDGRMQNGISSYHEWRETLTQEQRDYEMWRVLQTLDRRLVCLERRPLWDKTLAFAGGVAGGFLAVISYLKLLGGNT